MAYPVEYIDYLTEFHGSRDYFECHEILEEYWKKHTPLNRQSVWVGLIQVAVGFYHYRRNNLSGAERMMKKSYAILSDTFQELNELGIDSDRMLLLIQETLKNIKSNVAYTSPELPIKDSSLKQACMQRCREKSLPWNSCSNLLDSDLIDKHAKRDRKDIINERVNQLNIRKENKKA